MTFTTTETLVAGLVLVGMFLAFGCGMAYLVARPFHQYYCRILSQHEEALNAERRELRRAQKLLLAKTDPSTLQVAGAFNNGQEDMLPPEIPDHSQGQPSNAVMRLANSLARQQIQDSEAMEFGPPRPTGPGFGE